MKTCKLKIFSVHLKFACAKLFLKLFSFRSAENKMWIKNSRRLPASLSSKFWWNFTKRRKLEARKLQFTYSEKVMRSICLYLLEYSPSSDLVCWFSYLSWNPVKSFAKVDVLCLFLYPGWMSHFELVKIHLSL